MGVLATPWDLWQLRVNISYQRLRYIDKMLNKQKFILKQILNIEYAKYFQRYQETHLNNLIPSSQIPVQRIV